ncbi:hypothetical protein ACHAW6_004660 [Cyclotella cf. meneghiniana]
MKMLITDKYKMAYKLIPPGCHCHNIDKVAIQHFKSHFRSILAGIVDGFPPKLWNKLLPQAEITINLLRKYNATPTLSYTKKSDFLSTWAFHSIDVWYLGTSPEHCHTHKYHIKTTNNE